MRLLTVFLVIFTVAVLAQEEVKKTTKRGAVGYGYGYGGYGLGGYGSYYGGGYPYYSSYYSPVVTKVSYGVGHGYYGGYYPYYSGYHGYGGYGGYGGYYDW
ncbi:keratin-associated protein 19-2-like [Tribolium madens]|uniref:keratin-associated protein 19-2-like n=1 Tax=Tribolium madens TaxID=41895 RepID=UPI001CF72ADE|nr:keratin-associated protein 19-2-like [Tribolium madens]XP_044255275.1 keratin-associated protein 19-2-like [Tribolium madens]